MTYPSTFRAQFQIDRGENFYDFIYLSFASINNTKIHEIMGLDESTSHLDELDFTPLPFVHSIQSPHVANLFVAKKKIKKIRANSNITRPRPCHFFLRLKKKKKKKRRKKSTYDRREFPDRSRANIR